MAKPVKVIGMFQQDTSVLVHSITMNDNTARMMGFAETTCDECGAQCWIGPAQRKEYEMTKGAVALMCFGCVLFGRRVVFHTHPDTVEKTGGS